MKNAANLSLPAVATPTSHRPPCYRENIYNINFLSLGSIINFPKGGEKGGGAAAKVFTQIFFWRA